jgi:hypothetical protein
LASRAALGLAMAFVFFAIAPAFAAPPSEEMLNSVFIVGVKRSDGGFENVGTAWTIRENWLATNAHVAEALLELSVAMPGSQMVARRGVFDRSELVLENIRIHPAYIPWNKRMSRMVGQDFKEFSAEIPVADVAVMEVTLGSADTPLPCCDINDASHIPQLGEDITYIGFPSENISGFATAHVVRGNLTAMTDFFYQRTDWSDCHLIHFAGPIAGGASGSPVFDSDGRVIGLLSAGEFGQGASGERITQSFSYAQRVDLALELLDDSVVANQARRDRQWLARAQELFIDPDELIEELVRSHELEIGLEGTAEFTEVTNRLETIPVTATDRSIRVVMEPQYAYGFIAVAHDGCDLDLFIRGSDGTEYGSDILEDQFPVVWLDPMTSRTEVQMVLHAAEPLLLDTPITARVVRVPASAIPEPVSLTNIHTETVTAEANGAATWTWTIQADPNLKYICNANSADMVDIDLRLRREDAVIAEDVLLDWYPRVEAGGYSGDLVLELVLPEATVAGQQFEVTIDTTPHDGEPTLADVGGPQRLHTETITADVDGAASWSWTIQADPGLIYTCRANSADGLDIDLQILQGETLLAEDVLLDWYPRVDVSGYGGELTLLLLLPETTRSGQQFEVTIDIEPVQ